MLANQGKAGGLSLGGKLVVFGIPLVVGLFLLLWGASVIFPKAFQRQIVASSVPTSQGVGGEVTQAARTMSGVEVAKAVNGGSNRVVQSGCKVRLLTIPWNATMGLDFANGGIETTEGSLMAESGVRLELVRQDDYSKMQSDQVKFAEAVKNGDLCPQDGAAFVIIMGDGYPAYAEGLRQQMAKLGQWIEVVGAVGYSYGEDKCMLPYEVVKDPQKARGSLIGAVLRDGDYNICVTWAAQNGIPINADEKTYDPDAMNFVATDSFVDAGQKYITGFCDDRPVVSNGKLTGEKRHVCVNGVATWTPGDVTIAKDKGGLGSVASTREYSFQMPAVIIGNRDFMKRNPKMVEGLLKAALKGGEVIQTGGDEALQRAAKVAAKVYNEQSPSYWAKYYKGGMESDKQGHQIFLGGSRAIGLSETSFLFGLNGMDNLYQRIYEEFGDHNAKYYPKLTPTYPKYGEVVNTSYLENIFEATAGSKEAAQAAVPTYSADDSIKSVVASRSWHIEFDSGKATIRNGSYAALKEMLGQIALSSLRVEIHGYTDDVGSDEVNIPLSKKRAEAVKHYLMTSTSFPEGRVQTFGHGSSNPIAHGTSAEARQMNRRVEVILGTTN